MLRRPNVGKLNIAARSANIKLQFPPGTRDSSRMKTRVPGGNLVAAALGSYRRFLYDAVHCYGTV